MGWMVGRGVKCRCDDRMVDTRVIKSCLAEAESQDGYGIPEAHIRQVNR
jgi:hypothetical protein